MWGADILHRAAACFAAAAAALPLQGLPNSMGMPALNLTTLLTALSRLLGAAPAAAVAGPEVVTAQIDLALRVLSGGHASRAAASGHHDNLQVTLPHLPRVVEFASLCMRVLLTCEVASQQYPQMQVDFLTSFLVYVVSV